MGALRRKEGGVRRLGQRRSRESGTELNLDRIRMTDQDGARGHDLGPQLPAFDTGALCVLI